MREIWKSVKGFEGKYEVSNLGNVRSVDREILVRNGYIRKFKGKTLKPLTTTTPYLYVILPDRKHHSIHRLVAEAFLEKKEEYDSIKEASERTGFNKGAIRNCVKGLTKTSYGYHWMEYTDSCEEFEKI